jgi:hypothetical protein
MLLNLLIFLSALTFSRDTLHAQPPTAADVFARMIERDRERQADLEGFTGQLPYVFENERHHKHAEMLVRVTCLKNGSKSLK